MSRTTVVFATGENILHDRMIAPKGEGMRQKKQKASESLDRGRLAIRCATTFEPLESRQLMSTVVVNSFADVTHVSGSTISLRDAVNTADNTDGGTTIELPSGTYTLTQGALELASNIITIKPVSGTPVISGNHESRVFTVDGSASVTLTGLTIENGTDDSAGGGISDDGELTLNNCTVTANSVTSNAGQGGGIWADDNLSINNSTISNNSVGMSVADTSGQGGGIFNGYQEGVDVTNSTITGNTAGYGGGIFNEDDSFGDSISNSTISNNSVSDDGGGIYNQAGDGFNIISAEGMTLINNSAFYSGGGIYIGASDTTGVSKFINCTITGNEASFDNSTSFGGGGVYNAGLLSVGNSVIAQNVVDDMQGGQVTTYGTDYQGPVTSLGHNVTGIADDNTSDSGFQGQNFDQSGTTSSPLNPELTAPTGSPAVEIPIGENLDEAYIADTSVASPLIDQGDNSLINNTTDARGLNRIIGGTVDIGAVETQISITPVTTTFSVAAGVPITFPVGSFTDAGGSGPYTVIVDYANKDGVKKTVTSTGSVTATDTFDDSDSGYIVVEDGFGTYAVEQDGFGVTAVETPQKLTGTAIGTAGSYQGKGSTFSKAVDNDLTSYFDGASANGNYVGQDLGSSGGVVTEIAYASRSGFQSRMNGGLIQASNNASFTSPVTLYTVSNNSPAAGTLTFATLSNTAAYRYYRYLSPNNSYGNIAELDLFGTAGGLTVTPIKLTGTTIGTSGSYQNDGMTIANATDGNLNTYYNAATANGNWVGLDLGPTGGTVTQVKFASRAGWQSRMNGGKIQASSSASFTNPVTLYTIGSNANPPSGSLTTASFTNNVAYRYYRYLSPNGSYGNISEIQFLGTAGGLASVFSGTAIGSSGSYQNAGDTYAKALDGNLSTFFNAPTAGTSASNDAWVGVDLGSAKVVNEVAFASRANYASRMNGGEIEGSNTASFSGATVLYTIGSNANPPAGTFNTAQFNNTTAYRYYRYLSPNGSYGNIAELEFLTSTVAI